MGWGAIGLGAGSILPLEFCAPTALWSRPATLPSLVLALDSPAALALEWALMITAMMPPLIVEPLRHVIDRSFAKRRGRAVAWFAVGYGAAWMVAGITLQSMALIARVAAQKSPLPPGIAVIVALVWQVSPAKQRCLNACHRRPPLAAFGIAADLDAFAFGSTQGAWCVGACWALMLLPLLVGRGHLPTMTIVALFLLAERFERPAPYAWRLRVPGKALRIVAAQIYRRLDRMACSRALE
jgi:predicted metal-binding membrane protein